MSDAVRHARWLVDTLGSIPNHQYNAVERHAMPVARALLAAVEGSALTPRDEREVTDNGLLDALRNIRRWMLDLPIPTEGATHQVMQMDSVIAELEGAAWQPIETAPYGKPVLAWLFLPKNPQASGCVIATRCYVERDDPPSYPEHERQTQGCWWANGRYYSARHVTRWKPLPTPPKDDRSSAHRGEARPSLSGREGEK
jgi:hypothetical protein